jgi:hypothetical protein
VRSWLGLPPRDWLLLPLTSLITLCLMLAVGELTSRVIWPEHLQDACLASDQRLGTTFKANCRSMVKSTETAWIENAYNECGYRTAESCGPRAVDGFRVAVIGSSIGSGYLIPYDETFSARATEALKRRCRIPVDFQNLAVPGSGLDKALLHVEPALALKPNVLLMALAAHDLEVLGGDDDRMARAAESKVSPLYQFFMQTAVRWRSSRAVLIAQHFLYENLDTYLPLYLKHGDEADYLRPPLSVAWQRRLQLFEQEVAQIAAQTKTAGAQFMLVFIPQRPHAALLQWKQLPSDIDPGLLGRTLGDIAQRHDVRYLDLTKTLASKGGVRGLYFSVDSHPNGAASAIVADSIVAELVAHQTSLATCPNRSQVAN